MLDRLLDSAIHEPEQRGEALDLLYRLTNLRALTLQEADMELLLKGAWYWDERHIGQLIHLLDRQGYHKLPTVVLRFSRYSESMKTYLSAQLRLWRLEARIRHQLAHHLALPITDLGLLRSPQLPVGML